MRREPIVYPEDDYDDERGVFTYTFIANRYSETTWIHVETNDERESLPLSHTETARGNARSTVWQNSA